MAGDDHFQLDFSTEPGGGVTFDWGLDIYPEGTLVLKIEAMDSNLKHCGEFQVETGYRIKIPGDAKPFDMYSCHYETMHSSEFKSGQECEWICKKDSFKIDKKVEEIVENGFIIFQLEIRITRKEKTFQASAAKQNKMFLERFESSYGGLGDVKIICDGKEFSCHKLLLTSHSPVFRAMFTQDCKENTESSVSITDSTPEAVQEFLFYMYHGMLRRVPCTSAEASLVFGLVHLASKYQVKVLMDSCKDVLVDIMNVSNILRILTVVDKYPELEEISKRLGSYVKENFEEIVKNKDWNEFMVTNPTLVTELFLTMKKEMESTKKAGKQTK
eukprot:GFUD01012000.1.p1 GENE.GFUD01012000.1~~GFUD01012000.1.p1  ORF type:complete len:380 (-),score=81.36 GFUD01012000.1:47-1033(-)